MAFSSIIIAPVGVHRKGHGGQFPLVFAFGENIYTDNTSEIIHINFMYKNEFSFLPLNLVLRAPLIARVILFTNCYDTSVTVCIGTDCLGVTRCAAKNVKKEKADNSSYNSNRLELIQPSNDPDNLWWV